MPKFHPSDICIGQHLCEYSGHNGQECEVLEVIECGGVFVCLHTFGKVVIVGTCYLVRWADGEYLHVAEPNLRKKPPKKKEIGSWDSIEKATKGWNPTKEVERT